MSIAELQLAVRRGEYSLARQIFLRLHRDPHAPMALVFAEMAVAEYRQGNLRAALTFAEAGEAVVLQQPVPDYGLLGRLRLNLMAFYMEAGEVARAITIGQKWLRELENDPERSWRRGRIYYNLALALRQRGGPNDNAEALRYYDLARADLRALREGGGSAEDQDRARVYEVMALQNAAWLLCEAGNLARARELATEAAVLLRPAEQGAQREQVLLAAHIALRQQETDQCLTLLSDFGMYGGDNAPPRQQFWAAWLAAHAYLRMDDVLLAQIHAVIAVDQAARCQVVYLSRLAEELVELLKPRNQS